MDATDAVKVRALIEGNERLKRTVAELHLDNHAYELLFEKRLKLSQRKAAVSFKDASRLWQGIADQLAFINS